MPRMRMIQQAEQSCCDGAFGGWCRTCGGHAYLAALGVAHCAGALEAENTYEQLRARGKATPATCPITPTWMARRLEPLLSTVGGTWR